MAFPSGLHVVVHHAAPAGGTTSSSSPVVPVVLVHGSLDRGESFGRVTRRLEERPVVTYDRRGYQRSRHGQVVGLDGHVADLIGVVEATALRFGTPPAVVGHSLGGDVVLGAAIVRPDAVWAVGAYEPPMPWLGLPDPEGAPANGAGRWQRLDEGDPGAEAEAFFCRMVGEAAWARLSETARESRRADGPALVADLRGLRAAPPFDVTTLAVPAVFGRGGPASRARHRQTVDWLAANVAGAERMVIEPAGHGAHLSHPGAFCQFVRMVVGAGARQRTPPVIIGAGGPEVPA